MVLRARHTRKKLSAWLPPALGYNFILFLRLLRGNKVLPRYYPRVLAIFLINVINMPFRWYERKFINPRIDRLPIQEDPVFIIGHWRSGTTHLHNLLSQDQNMGYVTTYHSVFPDSLFSWMGGFIFKNFMRLLIAPTRKGDNVRMNPDFPQEEEFATGSQVPVCFYNFFIFPERILDFYRLYIDFEQLNEQCLRTWQHDYRLTLKKALKNTGTIRFISKNPSNTGRIRAILELFPNARFIHIHRNPVIVFLSTRHFFRELMPVLQLHSIPEERLEEMIFEVFDRIMHKYLRDRSQIPVENLLEVSFDDLETEPLRVLERIYTQFGIPGFDDAKSSFVNYLQQSQGYRKNVHHISRKHLEKILQKWDFAMKEWGYSVPYDQLIIDE